MKFYNSEADIHVPDGVSQEETLGRTTYMSIAAHQDDCEIMAYHALAKCYGKYSLHIPARRSARRRGISLKRNWQSF